MLQFFLMSASHESSEGVDLVAIETGFELIDMLDEAIDRRGETPEERPELWETQRNLGWISVEKNRPARRATLGQTFFTNEDGEHHLRDISLLIAPNPNANLFFEFSFDTHHGSRINFKHANTSIARLALVTLTSLRLLAEQNRSFREFGMGHIIGHAAQHADSEAARHDRGDEDYQSISIAVEGISQAGTESIEDAAQLLNIIGPRVYMTRSFLTDTAEGQMIAQRAVPVDILAEPQPGIQDYWAPANFAFINANKQFVDVVKIRSVDDPAFQGAQALQTDLTRPRPTLNQELTERIAETLEHASSN